MGDEFRWNNVHYFSGLVVLAKLQHFVLLSGTRYVMLSTA